MYLLPRMMLLLLLSAGTSQTVDVNWLTRVVKALINKYRVLDEFCVAANIPAGWEPNTPYRVLDPYNTNVKRQLGRSKLYVGNAVVIAKPLGSVHAEPRVLQNLQRLAQNRQGRVLVIYSYLSPCSNCADPTGTVGNTLRNTVISWPEYAFVFRKVYSQPGFSKGQTAKLTKTELQRSLTDLASSGLGLQNIFRCDKPDNLEFQCHSCSSRGQVTDFCVESDQPEQGGSTSSEISRKQPRLRTQSESSSGSNRARKRMRTSSESRRRSSRSRSGSRGGRRSSRSRSGSRGGRRSSRSSSRSRGGRRSSSFGGVLV